MKDRVKDWSKNDNKIILDRTKHEVDANKYYAKHIEMLTELVNFGTNLIPNTYALSNKKLEDIIVIGVLLKQVVLMADACSLLVSKGAVHSAYLQCRAAFEASIYIDWIFKSDSRKKAQYYYVWNIRSRRLGASRIVPGSPENKVFHAVAMKELGDYNPNFDDHLELAKDIIGQSENLLNKPAWATISKEFEAAKGNQVEYEREWYKVLEKKLTIKKIAETLDRLMEYYTGYSRSSEIMHGSTYSDHIIFKEGKVSFEPIRQLKEANLVFHFILTTVVHTYESILRYYQSPEVKHFATKYKADWRDTFLNIPYVEYKSAKTPI